MSLQLTKGLTPRWWTPDGQDDVEKPVEFQIRPLTGPQMLEIREHFDVEEQTIRPQGLLEATRVGLRDWRNVTNDKGDEEKYHKSMIDRLPHDWIALIGAQVISDSVITQEDEKN